MGRLLLFCRYSFVFVAISLLVASHDHFRGVSTADASGTFLKSLALKASVIPAPNQGQSFVTLRHSDSLTVVFSRPVLALGQDFDPTEEDIDAGLPYTRPFILSVAPEYGSSVPAPPVPAGRVRWVTTSIARFDPIDPWPTGLVVTLEINPELKSHDGVGIAPMAPASFKTGAMQAPTVSVHSTSALTATDGLWSAATAPLVDGSLECPHDAVVTLRFAELVQLSSIRSALQASGAINPSALVVRSCAEQEAVASDASEDDVAAARANSEFSHCVAILLGELPVGQLGTLQLPRGARYNPNAGGLSTSWSQVFSGLVPFTFPFVFSPSKPAPTWEEAQFRRLRLWVRHGLPLLTNLGDIRDAITLQPVSPAGGALSVTVERIDGGTLMIIAPDLQPETLYSIRIAAVPEVVDEFGLPMLESLGQFRTGPLRPVFLTPTEDMFFRPANSIEQCAVVARRGYRGWEPYGTGGSSDPSSMGFPYLSVTHIPASLSANEISVLLNRRYHHPSNTHTVDPLSGLPKSLPESSTTTVYPSDSSLSELAVPLGPRGLFFQQVQPASYVHSSRIVSISDLCAVFASPPGAESITVWVTECDSANPVSGVEVLLYGDQIHGSSITLVSAEGILTDDDGVAALPAPALNQYYRLLAVVRRPATNDVTIWPSIHAPAALPEASVTAAVLSDRAVYKPLDTASFTGYVRVVDPVSRTLAVPTSSPDTTWMLSVDWNPGHPTGRVEYPVELTEVGSFTARVQVPGGASFGEVEASLNRVVATESFTTSHHTGSVALLIADPRPPTVAMTVESTSVRVDPDLAVVPLHVETSSYLGGPSPDAAVQLAWSVERLQTPVFAYGLAGWPSAMVQDSGAQYQALDFGWNPAPTTPSTNSAAAGVATLTTDDSGLSDFSLDVSKDGSGAAVELRDGDTVSVVATWIGPTGERVVRRVSVPVAAADMRLGISAPDAPVLPGVEFEVAVSVEAVATHAEEDGMGTPVDVHVALWPWADPESAVTHRSSSSGDPVSSTTPGPSIVLAPGPIMGEPFTAVSTCNASALPAPAGGASLGGSTAARAGVVRCRFTLPTVGVFAIVASTRDHGGALVGASVPVGRTEADWQASPLSSFGSVSVPVLTDADAYPPNSEVRLSFYNPLRGARAMLLWGSPGAVLSTRQETLPDAPGPVSLSAQLDENCLANCEVTVVVVAPSQAVADALPIPVAVSALFDVTQPRSFSRSVAITVTAQPGMEGMPATATSGPEGEPIGTLPELNVQVQLDSTVVVPGAEGRVTVTLTDASGLPVTTGDVTIMVVDKAMLDVHPPPAIDLRRTLSPLAAGPLPSTHTDDTRSHLDSGSGYNESRDAAMRRLGLDPWVHPAWFVDSPSWVSEAEVDMTDEEFFRQRTQYVTEFPSRFLYSAVTRGGSPLLSQPVFEEMNVMESAESADFDAAPAAGMDGGAGGGGGGGGGGDDGGVSQTSGAAAAETSAVSIGFVDTRTAFETTPLFETKAVVSSDGSVSFDFKFPDNVGTFVVKAVAASVPDPATHLFGSSSAEVIARKGVTLQPALPRVLRIGDEFSAGVTMRVVDLAGPGDDPSAPYTVEVTAEVVDDNALVALAEPSASTQTVSAHAQDTLAVRFAWVAAKSMIGSARLQFRATLTAGPGVSSADPESLSDALEAVLDVTGVLPPVTVATSFGLEVVEGNAALATEGLRLPNALHGSGSLTLSGGVGHLAALFGFAAQNTHLRLDSPYLDGRTVVMTTLPPVILAAYALVGEPGGAMEVDPSTELTPQVVLDMSLSRQQAAVGLLPSFTSPNTGLRYSRTVGRPYVSVSLNALGVFIARRSPLLSGSVSSGIPGSLSDVWTNAMATQLVADVMANLEYDTTYSDWHTLSLVKMALGMSWAPGASETVMRQLSYPALLTKAASSLSSWPAGLLAQVAAAAVLDSVSSPVAPGPLDSWVDSVTPLMANQLNAIVNELHNRIRVQGRTAFVAYPGTGTPESIGDQGLALLVLSLAPTSLASSTMLPRLAQFVAAGGDTGYGVYSGVRGNVFGMFGLAVYDLSRGSAVPDVSVRASAGSTALFDHHFTPVTVASASAPGEEATSFGKLVASTETRWSDLPIDVDNVIFKAAGSGEVFVAAALVFTPADIPVAPMYRGLYVERIFQMQDPVTGAGKGEPLQVFTTGTVVQVTIQITTPDQVDSVTIVDVPPVGLEPINPLIDASSANGPLGMNPSSWIRSISCARWWGWCPTLIEDPVVTRDRVTWTARRLSAGSHSLSYSATVVTPGVFVLPPTIASVDDQPELMGMSSGGKVVVISKPDVIATDSQADVLARVGVPALPDSKPAGCETECDIGYACDLSSGTCVAQPSQAMLVSLAVPDSGNPTPPDNSGGLPAATVAGIVLTVGIVGVLAAGIYYWRRSHLSSAPNGDGVGRRHWSEHDVPDSPGSANVRDETDSDLTDGASPSPEPSARAASRASPSTVQPSLTAL